MRVPASWLGEFVDLPEDVTAEHLHAALVKVGLEEEDVHGGDISGPIVVGQVLSLEAEPQSNGKTINWCSIDVGEAEPRGIVCGAHNFGVGDKVVVTLPGAVLPGPFPIAARKTYGHVSDGMIASARELGLGDEHGGILRFADLGLDPVVGADALTILGLGDFAVEVNVTPDRGYAFSIRGIAREYAHSTGAAFRDPASQPATLEADGFNVTIDDSAPIRGRAGATGFVTRVVRGIDPTAPTPAWMVSRLALVGVRPISIAVDITNYVMFELGQPLHGYDLDKLSGGITVRRAAAGEKLTTLDGQERALDAEDLLITDDSGPIGLAGVMGGLTTEITDATKDVLLEAATFDQVSIARTARRHRLPSEASKRFERGVDPLVAAPAAARAAELLVEFAGGTIDTLGSTLSTASIPPVINLPEGYATRLIGVDYTVDEVRSTLEAIGASVVANANDLQVTPPSWRPDLIDAPSLVEEVARITGYDRIPSVLPVAPPGRGLTREQVLRRAAGRGLASAGLTEALTHPFQPLAAAELFGSADGSPVSAMKVANPLDPAAAWMRTSLLPGLIETAHRNVSRGLTDLAVFEIGHVYLPQAGAEYGSGSLPIGNALPDSAVLTELESSIPPQPWHVGAIFVGNAIEKQPGSVAVASGIADAIAAAHQVALSVGASLRVETGSHHAMHPGRTAQLSVGDRVIGYAGELLPSIAVEANLPRVVGVLELDLDWLITSAPADIVATPISGFNATTQDLSVVVGAHVPAGSVLEAVVFGAGSLLEDARLVDDYRGAGVADGSKSLTFALRFRAPDRTLTADEATDAKLAGLAAAFERVGATLRE